MTNRQAQADDLLVMGRIAAPWGVKGWLRVTSYTEVAENLLEYLPWFLSLQGNWTQIKPVNGKVHGKGLVIQLEGCTDRDAAAGLSGTEIAIHRDQLPVAGPNEYYWDDLIGLQVVTEDGQAIGTIERLLETGSNDVLVVQGEREHLVPYILDQVIKAVDLDKGVIRVNWDIDF